MSWSIMFYGLGVACAGWFLYQYIKQNPGAFSSHNTTKSLITLGWLALLLIGFITCCILFLKS